MWHYHTQVNGWSDIAQHLTIAPDGTIWIGRNWNQPPASAAGHNGNRTAGPFMFEMIGDFNSGSDRFEDPQRNVALQVIALVQKRFGLAPEMLRFHNQMSSKTCPGSAIDYHQIVSDVHHLHAPPRGLEGAVVTGGGDGGPFGDEALASHAVIMSFSRELPAQDDPADAEPDEDTMSQAQLHALFGPEELMPSARLRPSGVLAGQRTARIPPEVLNALRPHVINLNLGRFSSTGQLTTTPGDVDAIFEYYLVRELEGANARNEPLRLLFYAHGGLVKESSGLQIADKHVLWWKRNHVYPLYIVWETGLLETLSQLLRRARQTVRPVTRDVFDSTTDPVVEELVRALYGPRIWSGMKHSAELAVAQDGGARYVAKKLQEFCDRYQGKLQDHRDLIELHAVGHSAGAIFHAHFIPAALGEGTPSFRTVHLLAPAIRVDAFHAHFAERLGEGKGIDHLTLFTMNNSRERADDCAGIYRKSLLYLISHALEPEPKTPILGLEVALRNDPRLRELFGLGAMRSPIGEVVWSTTLVNQGRSASQATRHGEFDDDAPTMNSIARRVVGADDNDPITDFPPTPADAHGRGTWDDQVDWPEGLDFSFEAGGQTVIPGPTPAPGRPPMPTLVTPAQPVAAAPVVGRRRALCIGINQYPTAALYGCVADAQTWQATLQALGFSEIVMLLDQQATREAILKTLTDLVTTSTAGDVVVLQYAGHGTQLPDLNRDEAGGDTPDRDEAICPIDFADGRFIIDDDIGAVFEQIPSGVNVTCFMDCCHSGTISRFGVGAPSPTVTGRQGPLPRFIVPTPQMITAHRQFRQRQTTRRAMGRRGLSGMQEVLFAACLSSEVAYENAGHGDFTVRATGALQAGLTGLTNEQFEERIIAAFGAGTLQHPRLYCRPEAKPLRLLQPLTGAPSDRLAIGARKIAALSDAGGRTALTAQLLRLAASMLEEQG
jgi:hypothetical protein